MAKVRRSSFWIRLRPVLACASAPATILVACSLPETGAPGGAGQGGASPSSAGSVAAGGVGLQGAGGSSGTSQPSGGSGVGGVGAGGTVSGAAGRGGLGGVSSGGTQAGGTSASGTGGASSAGAAAGGAPAGGTGAAAGNTSAGQGGKAGSNSSGGAGTGSGGSSGVARSKGCGTTPNITFETVPGESGQATGFGEGGYVRIANRGFALRLPDDYDQNKPYWLIFGFHWRGGNAKEVDTGGTNRYEMAHYGLQKLSNNGAIFVAPDGLGGGWANSGGEDLAFVDDMVEFVTENYCVDTKRVFANGFSWGGGMSYAIACARADVFRAVAIYNGAVLSGCEGGSAPIAYWQMAGQTDTTCTIGAGRQMRDQFVRNNGCTDQDPPEPPQPPPYLRPGGHTCTTYQGCNSGYPVRWCAHQSGHGNAVVDGTADLFHACANPPSMCSDSCPCSWVPGDVWSFFNSL